MECQFGELLFSLVGKIEPECDERGGVLAFFPAAGQPKHQYGEGPFCRFQIAQEADCQRGGVYILTKGGQPFYVGQSDNLRRAWGTNGFGRITSANLHAKGGRSTMCRINNEIFQGSQNGADFCLWFYPVEGGKSERDEVKKDLVTGFHPPWNK